MAALGLDISLQDIAGILGESTDQASDLFLSSAVNRWSPCKPFVNSSKGFASFAAFRAALAAQNYGFTVPSAIMHDPRTAALSAYAWNRPSANFRIGDFRHYCHDAAPVITSIPSPEVQAGYVSASFNFTFQASGEYALGITDFAPIQSYYLAVILTNDSWSTTYIVTSDDTVADGATRVVLNSHTPFDTAGTWQYMLVACSLPSPVSGQAQTIASAPFGAASYIPLPFGHPAQNLGTLTVTAAASLYVRLTYTWTSASDWTVTPVILLDKVYADDVRVCITKMAVTRSGNITQHQLSAASLAVQQYDIMAGSTAPRQAVTPLTPSSFHAPAPSMEEGDIVQFVITVTPADITTYNMTTEIE